MSLAANNVRNNLYCLCDHSEGIYANSLTKVKLFGHSIAKYDQSATCLQHLSGRRLSINRESRQVSWNNQNWWGGREVVSV